MHDVQMKDDQLWAFAYLLDLMHMVESPQSVRQKRFEENATIISEELHTSDLS